MNLGRLASLLLAASLAALALAWRCDRGRLGSEVRAHEERALRAEGFLVASHSRIGELESLVPELRAELERLRSVSPGSRVAYVTRGATGPVVAGDGPRTIPAQPQGQPCGPCLLAPGDRGEVRCSVAGVETRAGSQIVLGTGEAWRLEPGPPARLLGGLFSAPLTTAVSVAPTRQSGIGVGVLGSCSSSGCGVGPALAAPSISLPFGRRLDLSAGLTVVGPLSAGATAIVR